MTQGACTKMVKGGILRPLPLRASTISPVLPSVLRTRFFFLAAPRRRDARMVRAPVFRGLTQRRNRSRATSGEQKDFCHDQHDTDTTPIQIFDTTLRDGEQSPGAAMTHEEKLQIAELLDEMGVDIIEAGFPISSPGDFKAVQEISKIVKRASVCGLSRAGFKDIDRAGEALKGAHRPRIHTFISTSPVHMKHKLNMGENAVLEAIGASVTRARNYTSEVEWSAEDATRTVPDFLCRCVDVAINAGATVINVPDTVGYSTPQEFFDIITMLRERVPNADKVIFSTHCP